VNQLDGRKALGRELVMFLIGVVIVGAAAVAVSEVLIEFATTTSPAAAVLLQVLVHAVVVEMGMRTER
jgi:hypothetical protein